MKKPPTKITLTAATLLAIVLLVVGIRVWKNRPGQIFDPLSNSKKPLVCPVHDVACREEKRKAYDFHVSVHYDPGYEQARHIGFPLSGQDVHSSYAPSPYEWVTNYYCPQCREARSAWFTQREAIDLDYENAVAKEIIRSIFIPRISFKEASLLEVCDSLEQEINKGIESTAISERIKIIAKDKGYAPKMTFSMERAPAGAILTLVSTLTGVEYSIDGLTITFEDTREYDGIGE